MKTEDIDKKIGMPDVDKEWARFEQEVIGKEPKANKRSIYSWIGGLGIAACLLLFFLINMGDEPKPATPVVAELAEPEPVQQPAVNEVKEEPIVHIVNTPRFKNALRKELAMAEPKPATPVVAEEAEPEPTQQPAEEEVKEDPIVHIVSSPQPKKEPVLANNDTPASKGLKTSAHEYTGKVQKFNMDDVKDLAFKSVDQSLKDDGREFHEVTSLKKEVPLSLRLRGRCDKETNSYPLVLVNGEPLPDSLIQQVLELDDIDTYMHRYFYQQHLLLDEVYVYKDSEITEKFGERGKHGVIELRTVPDTFCDDYVKAHPRMKKKYRRIEGYVVGTNNKLLTKAWVYIKGEPDTGAATDSMGHFAFWVPKKDITLCVDHPGYKRAKFQHFQFIYRLEPDSNVNDQNLRLRGNPKPTSESQGQIAGSPDTPPNDSILYLINGKPQPKENNKWLSKDTYLDYFKKQHLHVERVMDYTNVKQRYIEKFGEAAKYGVVEYICVEDTRGDYYMEQHEELKANRRRVSGVVLDENDKPLGNTTIFILHDKGIWGTEKTDSSGNFAFWVPRTDVKLDLTHYGYKPVVVEPTDTFQTIHLLPTATMQSTK